MPQLHRGVEPFWRLEADYPYAKTPLIYFSVVSFKDSFIVFGGLNDHDDERKGSAVVARFWMNTRQWFRLADMKEVGDPRRFGHKAAYVGEKFRQTICLQNFGFESFCLF